MAKARWQLWLTTTPPSPPILEAFLTFYFLLWHWTELNFVNVFFKGSQTKKYITLSSKLFSESRFLFRCQPWGVRPCGGFSSETVNASMRHCRQKVIRLLSRIKHSCTLNPNDLLRQCIMQIYFKPGSPLPEWTYLVFTKYRAIVASYFTQSI